MHFRTVVLTMAAVVGVLACGGSDPCSRTSPCPNDTPPTQSERDQCKATLTANQSAACYSEGVSYLNCTIDNTVCGGDGKTDGQLSLTKAENNCTNQKANLSSCCIKNPNSTVCI